MKKTTWQIKFFATILLAFMFMQSFGQDRWLANDKLMHVSTSLSLSFASGQLLYGVTGWKYSNEISALGIVGVGIAKEYLLDSHPSQKDIAMNIVGVTAGYFLNRVLNKRITKSLICNK